MSWSDAAELAIVALATASLALFAWERRRTPTSEERAVGTIFSNPYLRIFTILLMVFVVLRAEGAPSTLTWLPAIVVLIVGTTVAGADFILLLVALLKENNEFVREYYTFEREKFRAQIQAIPKPSDIVLAPDEPQTREARPPLEPLLAGLESIGAVPARSSGAPANEVRVAIVSTGAPDELVEHPALEGRVERTYRPEGTVVSEGVGPAGVGFVAALAPTARIFPLTVFNESFTGDADWIREGVEAALAWAPQVVFLDFGANEAVASVRDLIRRADDDVLFVAPAGNEGQGRPTWPASDGRVLGVAAATASKALAPFSNRGGGVHLAAPGVDVVSLVGVHGGELAFSKLSGTSMAAGIVAGLAALARSLAPELSPDELVRALAETGEPLRGHHSIRLVDAAAAAARMTPAAAPP
ncbi:MAG: S8 family serine peptidase [Thermoleophilia bacterium]|nr:S8 family serine peptidase [Thermoleophilia bacterium]